MLPFATINELQGQTLAVLVTGTGPCGYVEVVDWMGDEHRIADVARVGTGSVAKCPADDWKLIERLLRDSHSSPFEFCEIDFELRLPVFTLRQLFRYRTANQQEHSARYREMLAEFYVPGRLYQQHDSNRQMSGPRLDPLTENEVTDLLIDGHVEMQRTYRQVIEAGLSREQARIMLPMGTLTTVRWKIDLHNLLHILEQRLAPGAQEEIRAYAQVLADVVKIWLPHVWAAFVEHRLGAVRLSASQVKALAAMDWPTDQLASSPDLQRARKALLGSLPVTTEDRRQLELAL